jgi:hypothetical protein
MQLVAAQEEELLVILFGNQLIRRENSQSSPYFSLLVEDLIE